MARWGRIWEELPHLLQTYRLVWRIRVALWTLPFGDLREQCGSVPVNLDPPADRPTAMHLAWRVVIASRFVPGASCFTQALATDLLLREHGYSGQVQIGVAFNKRKQLTAHAWLEHDGVIIIGGRGHQKFQQLPPGTV